MPGPLAALAEAIGEVASAGVNTIGQEALNSVFKMRQSGTPLNHLLGDVGRTLDITQDIRLDTGSTPQCGDCHPDAEQTQPPPAQAPDPGESLLFKRRKFDPSGEKQTPGGSDGDADPNNVLHDQSGPKRSSPPERAQTDPKAEYGPPSDLSGSEQGSNGNNKPSSKSRLGLHEPANPFSDQAWHDLGQQPRHAPLDQSPSKHKPSIPESLVTGLILGYIPTRHLEPFRRQPELQETADNPDYVNEKLDRMRTRGFNNLAQQMNVGVSVTQSAITLPMDWASGALSRMGTVGARTGTTLVRGAIRTMRDAPQSKKRLGNGIRRIIESRGAKTTMKRRYSDPFTGKSHDISATAKTQRSMNTSIYAEIGEAEAYKAALRKGEIGLQRPGGANVKGADFITARRIDEQGRFEIIITDAKTSTKSKFPKPEENIPSTWKQEAKKAIGRLGLDDPELEGKIRQAYSSGRIRLRQINVDYSPAGQGSMSGW